MESESQARWWRLDRLESTHARLTVLLCLLLAIPLAVIVFQADLHRREQIDAQRRLAVAVARNIAFQESLVLGLARQQINQLAGALSDPDHAALQTGSDCARALDFILRAAPNFYEVGVARPDGDVACLRARPVQPISVQDRNYFHVAMKQRDPVLSEPLRDKLAGRWTIAVANSIASKDEVRGVLIAALDLRFAEQMVNHAGLPEGAIVSMVDDTGTVVARTPAPPGIIGQKLREAAEFAALIKVKNEGWMSSAGIDGIPRIVGFAKVPGSEFFVRVGIPETAIDAQVFGSLRRSAVVLGLMLLLFGVTAWLGSRKLVLAPLEKLREAADGMGHGDLTVRSGVKHSDSTIGRLARAFDHLAEQNQRVSRALRTLSAGNRTLLREREEQTLLVAMCSVAVEKGGYPLAFVNYANHDAEKSVTTVARYGRDTGFTDTLRLTWADTERGQGSVGTAIRSGQPSVFRSTANDPRFTPWRSEALDRGFLSVVSLPLREAGAVIGTFTLVAVEEDAFDEEELRLLTEMADDLSFGIQTIRERVRQESLQSQAEWVLRHDAVTGFANRAAFIMGLQKRIAAGEPGLSVFVIHLPYVQKVYDSFGYDSGNNGMREIARRLSEHLGERCSLARVQPDNFAFALPLREVDEVKALVPALRDAVFAQPVRIGLAEVDMTCTVGVSRCPEHGADPDVLLRRAAIAARDCANRELRYQVYSGSTQDENPQRLALAAELRAAIARGELCLVFQPKVHIATGDVVGCEALCRWVRADGRAVSPGVFIPLAEEAGLIRVLTYGILEMAIKQQAAWMRAGIALPVAVNLSVRNLYDPHLLDYLESLLESHGVPGELIDFEITESTLMEEPDAALPLLQRIRALGSKIYIDDFGTGYSSLAYLASLPVSALKIDRSFVSRMDATDRDRALVASIVSMASQLGLQAIAEGVEAQSEADALCALGCEQAQGYYYYKPLSVEEMAGVVVGHRSS